MEMIPDIFIDEVMYHTQAIAHYTQVLEIEHNVPDVYFFRAQHYRALGKRQKAARDLRQWGGNKAHKPAPLPGAQQWECVVQRLKLWMSHWGEPAETPASDTPGIVFSSELQKAYDLCEQGDYQEAIDHIWEVVGDCPMHRLEWEEFSGALRLNAYCHAAMQDWDTALLRGEASLLQECMRRDQYRDMRFASGGYGAVPMNALTSGDDVYNDYQILEHHWNYQLPPMEVLRAIPPGIGMEHPGEGVALSYLCLSELHRLLGNAYGAVVSRQRACMAAAER